MDASSPVPATTAVARSPYLTLSVLGLVAVTMAAGLLGGVGLAHCPPELAVEPAVVGYRDFAYGEGISATADKPESKLWWNDGSWWADMIEPASHARHIYRLDDESQTWLDTGTPIDARPATFGDALWDGKKLYIASRSRSAPARLLRFSYDRDSRGYHLDPGFPVVINNRPSQNLVLDKDSTGTLWITYSAQGRIWVARSLGDDANWEAPFVLPFDAAEVDPEDISALAAFGGDRVGVMWSNQLDSKYYFAVHRDGDSARAWTLEVADDRTGVADNHINLKADGSGWVYAAVKTSFKKDGPEAPLIQLLIRRPDGAWSAHTFGTTLLAHTAPIVQIDEEHRRAYVFAVRPGGGAGGGTIYMKSSPLAEVRFAPGPGSIFLSSSADAHIHNPTSTKQPLDGRMDLVVLASDKLTGRYLHNSLDLPGGDRVRFAALGDHGEYGEALRDVAEMIAEWNPAFVVTTGDNNYPDGLAETMDANVGQFFHNHIAPYQGGFGAGADVHRFFPVLGNHDWHATDAEPFRPYFSLPGNERYYQVTWGPVSIFALDSDPREPDGVSVSSSQAAWLKRALAASRSCWDLVVFHHTPYGSGRPHGNSEWMQWPFAEWGADAVMAAHNHIYERILQQGFPYFVNGLGGDDPDELGRAVPGSQVRFNADHGAMRITAERGSIVFEFITRRGVLVDRYRMQKDCD